MRRVFEHIQSVEDLSRLDEGMFQGLVADMFHDYGYAVAAASGPRGYGADLVMTKDGQKVVVQARQHEEAAGADDVRDAHFAKHYYGADEAWVVSARGFAEQAVVAAEEAAVHLVTGAGVLRLMETCTFEEVEPADELALPEESAVPDEPAVLGELAVSEVPALPDELAAPEEPQSTTMLVSYATFPEMFDGPAHELRALKFDTNRYGDPPGLLWGFLVVDRGVLGLNGLSGEAVDSGGVRFWVELDDGCERGYYAVRNAGQGSRSASVVEGHLEPKDDERGADDPFRREFGPIKNGFSVYLSGCHIVPSPGIDGAMAARVEEEYRRRVTPLVDEFWKVNGDKSDRGKLRKKDKLATLDGIHEQIRSTNVQFVARAKEVGLDHRYYVRRYGGSIGNELAPSAQVARAKETARLAKAKAGSQSSGELMGCLAEGCLKGCCFLIMTTFAVMMLIGYLMILFI